MKIRFIFILSLLMMGIAPSLADGQTCYGVVLLSHQGKETAYSAENAQIAVDAAEEGDVIQFSAGRFKEITLSKRVYLRKESDGPILVVNLDFPNNTAITESLFIGHYFDIRVKSNLQSLYLSECGLSLRIDNGVKVGNVILDRCYCGGLDYEIFNVNTLEANNCNVNGIYNGSKTEIESKFTNCAISSSLDLTGATFENCILFENLGYITIENCILTNCLFYYYSVTISETSTANNCYNDYINSWDYTPDVFLNWGYLSTDNKTVVGPLGGATPFNGTNPKIGSYVERNGDSKQQGRNLTSSYVINPIR